MKRLKNFKGWGHFLLCVVLPLIIAIFVTIFVGWGIFALTNTKPIPEEELSEMYEKMYAISEHPEKLLEIKGNITIDDETILVELVYDQSQGLTAVFDKNLNMISEPEKYNTKPNISPGEICGISFLILLIAWTLGYLVMEDICDIVKNKKEFDQRIKL